VFTAVCTLGKRDLLVRLLDAGIRVPPVAGGCQSYLLENPGMLRLLLAKGGLNPDYPTPEGSTLLHALCSRDVRGRTMNHRTECADILLHAGAAISAKDEEYRSTPLAWAARNNLPDMVEFLLPAARPRTFPTTNRGPRRSRGPSNVDTLRSRHSSAGTEQRDKIFSAALPPPATSACRSAGACRRVRWRHGCGPASGHGRAASRDPRRSDPRIRAPSVPAHTSA